MGSATGRKNSECLEPFGSVRKVVTLHRYANRTGVAAARWFDHRHASLRLPFVGTNRTTNLVRGLVAIWGKPDMAPTTRSGRV
jgi:hypothetical protein